MRYVSRSEWGAKPWASEPYRTTWGKRTETLIHYHGGPPKHSIGVEVPREVDAIHHANGWAGVGYNWLVDQAGTIYEGRGWGLVGAHCPGHNTSGIGIYVAVGGTQRPTDAALASARIVRDEACRLAGRRLRMSWHGENYPTACPGTILEAWARSGMPVVGQMQTQPAPQPAGTVASAPAFPLPAGGWFGLGDKGDGHVYHSDMLKPWQRQMYRRGWRINVNGYADDNCRRVAERFQREKGLTVDGMIGERTWRAAWTAPIT
jgi:hypothetical protein